MNDKVRAIFDLLGLEPWQLFYLKEVSPTSRHESNAFYFINEDLKVIWQKTGAPSGRYNLANLIRYHLESIVPVVIPFVPAIGEAYYYVGTKKDPIQKTARYNCSETDIMRIRLGNCYETPKEITDDIVRFWLSFYANVDKRIEWCENANTNDNC